jgi:hypothetical protein
MVYSLFQSVYNFFRKKNDVNKCSTEPYETIIEYDKVKKLQLFLQIRHIKNIYYKYTKNTLYREHLYNSFVKENDFDYGESAYDDETDTKIFDKYICDYIEKRKGFLDEFDQYGIEYECCTSIMDDDSNNKCDNNKIKITFIIDMTDRNILDYCMKNNNKSLDSLFSVVIIKNSQTSTKTLR